MKKIFLLLPSLAVLAFFASCERHPAGTEGPVSSDGLVPISFNTTGSLDYAIATRSDINTMMSGGFGVLGYNTGDEGFDADSPSGLFLDNIRMISEDGENWEYPGEVAYWNAMSADKYTFLAYHPYDESLETPVLSIPTSDINISDCIDYIVARPVIDQTSRIGVNLDFEHILSRFTTNVRLAAAYEGQSYTLRSVKFSGVHDYPSYSLAEGDFDRTTSVSHSIVSEKSDIQGATLSSASRELTVNPVYMSPYGYASEGKEIEVQFEFDYLFTVGGEPKVTHTFTKSITISKDLVKNRAYDLNVSFTPDEQGGIDIDVSLDDYTDREDLDYSVEQTEPVDLSEPGLANSYIVERGGYYRFCAAYKDDERTSPVGEADRVEVLWESYGTDDPISPGDLTYNVVLSGESILFNASDRKGNALIAAKDADGNILWSWHIWLTDRPGDQVYNDEAGIMMDRNLGATSALKSDGAKTYGLLYQWGRKDPFLGSGTAGGNSTALSTGVWPEPVQFSAEVGTAEYADAHPMTFIMDASENANDNWMAEPDYSRWAVEGPKPVYDPCPYGYRMPSAEYSKGIWHSSLGRENMDMGNASFDGGYDFGAGNPVETMTADPACWYPAAGKKSSANGNLILSGEVGTYWSGFVRTDLDSPQAYVFILQDGYAYSAISYKAFISGQSVRCVKETL